MHQSPRINPSRLIANINIGFGNFLTVRGEWTSAGGWDIPVQLSCVACDRWEIMLPVSKPVQFKFLLNDVVWEQGINRIAVPGNSIFGSPVFR